MSNQFFSPPDFNNRQSNIYNYALHLSRPLPRISYETFLAIFWFFSWFPFNVGRIVSRGVVANICSSLCSTIKPLIWVVNIYAHTFSECLAQLGPRWRGGHTSAPSSAGMYEGNCWVWGGSSAPLYGMHWSLPLTFIWPLDHRKRSRATRHRRLRFSQVFFRYNIWEHWMASRL